MPPSSRSRDVQKRRCTGRVCIIHWNAQEASVRIAALTRAGFDVDFAPVSSATLKKLRDSAPAAIIIDLTRLPSHGRDVALAIRERKATRHVPLIFVEGAEEKLDALRRLLPDATFTTWRTIRSALRKALKNPPANPVVPASRLAGYSGTPLPKKLGITPKARIDLVGAPVQFEETLGALPMGANTRRRTMAAILEKETASDLSICFLNSMDDLVIGAKHYARRCPPGGVWFLWRKKTAQPRGSLGLGEREIREVGLAAGLVDFKVCAVDAIWSGLKFTVSRAKR